MAQDQVEAEVVLTADNSQYDQAMAGSAQSTQALGDSVDTLGRKIQSMTKTAGKSLLGIAAADVATITAATAAYAAYENQISRLQAQAAIVGRGRMQEQKLLDTYTGSVKTLRKEYGTTTTEATQLTSQIAKLVDPRETRKVSDLSKVFTEMSLATGESSTGLSDSMLNLQKVMASPINGTSTRKYADQVSYLAQQTSLSAQGLTDFASQIAPVGRLLDLNQTQVTGVATAFAKAGQDGFAAANAFNTIVSDISYAAQSGSPELAKYAALIGMTTEQFQGLEGSEKILRIFDELNRMGPSAITKLNDMGLDGTRTLRAITAVSDAGGLRQGVLEARKGYGSDSVAEGAAAATKGMVDEFAKLRQELTMTGENLGQFSAAFGQYFLKGIEKSASALNTLTSGPFGKFLQLIMLAVAPITAFGGAVLLMAGALFKAAGAFTLVRNSGSRGLMEGIRGGARITPERDANGMLTGRYVGADGKALLDKGDQIARGGSSFQRGLYNTGQMGGSFVGGMYGVAQDAYYKARKIADPTYTPAGGSAYSKAAGTAAYLMRNLATPQLDQMRYSNPADRLALMSQHGILQGSKLADQLNKSMDHTIGMEKVLTQVQGAYGTTFADPKSSQAERDAAARAVTNAKADVTMAKAAEATADQAIKRDVRLNNAAGETTRGFRGLATSMRQFNAAAFIGGVKGAGAAGMFAIDNTIGRGRAAGLAGLIGGAALASTEAGSQSKALTMGMMGAGTGMMFTPAGAVAGAVLGTGIGMAMDVSGENDDIKKSSEMLKADIAAHPASITENAEALRKQSESLQDYIDKTEVDTEDKFQDTLPFGLGTLLNLGEMKNSVEGFFGKSNVEEEQARYQEAVDLHEQSLAGARKLLYLQGGNISGSQTYQEQRLEDYLQGEGGQKLSETGLTFEDFQIAQSLVGKGYNPLLAPPEQTEETLAQQRAVGQYAQPQLMDVEPPEQEGNWYQQLQYKKFTAIYGRTPEEIEAQLKSPLQDEERRTQIASSGPAGRLMTDNEAVGSSIRNEESLKFFQTAVNELSYGMRDMKPMQAYFSTEAAKAKIQDVGSREYEIQQGVGSEEMQAIRLGSTFQGRSRKLGIETKLYEGLMAIKNPTDEQIGLQNEQRSNMISGFMDQGAYFQQLLYQQREFDVQKERAQDDFAISRDRMEEEYNISRSRAQEDFSLQRRYQEQDYQLSRKRAEESYEISRERSQESFARSMFRNQQQFNISRRRQEQDHQHQVVLMTEQAAMSMQDIYERTQTQRTSGASYMLFNIQDQLEQMQGQTKALDQLRGLGLSDDAIQQLGLTDAANAQQAMRFAAEAADNPEIIKAMNQAIKKRLRAARELVTDESSKEWEEFQRQYSRATRQALEDFHRGVRQARKDFGIQMQDMEEDFQRAMSQGAEDYETVQQRQSKAFGKSMSRAAEDYARTTDNMTEDFHKSMVHAREDLERSATEISGSLAQILNKSVKSLTGNAKVQAREARKAFKDMRGALGEEGNATMSLLSRIFGFNFTPVPTGGGSNGGDPGGDPGAGPGPNLPRHGNHAAGGVLPGYSPGVDNLHYKSQDGSQLHLSGGEAIMVPEWVQQMGGPGAIGEMNRRARSHRSFFLGGTTPTVAQDVTRHTSGYPFATWAGDLNDPGQGDYGDPVVAWKRGTVAQVNYNGAGHQDGNSYGRWIVINHDGEQSSWYAHLSKASVTPGEKVGAGQRIGAVGDFGNTTGAHLHFEIRGGTVNIGDTNAGGSDSSGGMSLALSDVLKQSYSKIEAVAKKIGIGDPAGGDLFKNHRASHLFNRFLRSKWDKLVDKYGAPDNSSGHVGPMGHIPDAPEGSNQELVRKAMRQFGWHQWPSLYQLVMHESGFDNYAQNPTSTAYGMFQFLDSTWAGTGIKKTSDPWKQSIAGMRYIRDRYDDPAGAWDWWQDHNWYGKGGVFDGPQTIGVGEKGPEMVLPLDERGAHFISDVMSKLNVGNDSKASYLTAATPMLAHTLHTYTIDRSTTFSGPITVAANNPAEFLSMMRQKQRMMALSQGSIGGQRL